ncbi:MAG: prepilin peptidase [Desulfobacterales bacterium]|jgi:leader peptidase (prepilin peptidase)/N-methyltransferase|nr:prepilin peptidase [Desulfobacterales bacterium]
MDLFFPTLIVFLFGLCVGSFLNVCIYRLPKGNSIVRPRSMCPVCHTTLQARDNIPILSYLFLGGKCRQCRTPIPLRYPLVELITGLLALAIVFRFSLTPAALIFFVFSAALIVVTFIDIDHQIIPDVITLPGIFIFFAASFLLPHSDLKTPLIRSLLGILSGGGSLFLVAWAYHALTGKEGMGGGDIKLLAMIGALLGWQGVLFTIFTGSTAGCLVGLLLMRSSQQKMKLRVPFGPFLSLGALLYVFWGPHLIHWYFNLLR